jgi:hypothetical protein
MQTIDFGCKGKLFFYKNQKKFGIFTKIYDYKKFILVFVNIIKYNFLF